MNKHPDKDHAHQLCAVCYNGSRVVSYGFNKPRTQAAIASISERVDCMYPDSDIEWVSQCSHAEVSALKKATSDVDTVVVVRKTKGNNLGCSRPCNICMEFMKDAGVESVIYINQQGVLAREAI